MYEPGRHRNRAGLHHSSPNVAKALGSQRMKPGGGVSPLTKSLLVASLLHAGLFAYIVYFGPPPKPAAAPMEPLVWVDTPIEPSVAPPPDTPADSEAEGAEERVAASAPRGHAGVPAPGTEAPGEGSLEPGEPGE